MIDEKAQDLITAAGRWAEATVQENGEKFDAAAVKWAQQGGDISKVEVSVAIINMRSTHPVIALYFDKVLMGQVTLTRKLVN